MSKTTKTMEGSDIIEPVPSQPGFVEEKDVLHDDVFGDITGSGPNYRSVCAFVSDLAM